MRMSPRKYGTMNRVIAKAVSHSVNDYYRQKKRSNTYKQYNNTQTYYKRQNGVSSPSAINNTEDNALVLLLGSVILFVLIVLACAFPMIIWLYIFLIMTLFLLVKN